MGVCFFCHFTSAEEVIFSSMFVCLLAGLRYAKTTNYSTDFNPLPKPTPPRLRRLAPRAFVAWAPTFKLIPTPLTVSRHRTKCGAERICGADLNGDNLRISRAYLRISDHSRGGEGGGFTFRVRVRVRVRNMVRVRVSISVRVSVRVGVADCCIQTAGKSDKMRINHVIKTVTNGDPPRSAFCRVPCESTTSLPATSILFTIAQLRGGNAADRTAI